MIRYPCSNVCTMTYSGKESSPLGIGISAEGYEVNFILNGKDEGKWIVKIKNNRKVWVRYENKNANCEEKVKTEDVVVETVSSDKPVKQVNNYLKYLTKRKEILSKEYNGSKTSKEIYNEILKEWKELKKDSKKYQEIINTL